MRPLTLAALACCICSSAHAEDLKATLLQRQKTLADLSTSIDQAASGPSFQVSHDLHASLETAALQQWLTRVTTPGFTITGIGTRREDDLYYKGGVGKAWLEPEHDTRVTMTFSPFVLHSAPSHLGVSSHLTGHAEARVRLYIFNVGSNVFCQTNPDLGETVAADLQLGAVTNEKVAYSLRLASPSSVTASVTCYFGALGGHTITFPMDQIAQTLSSGDIPLGYKTTITLPAPTGGSPGHTVHLNLSGQGISVDARQIDASANVAIGPVTTTSP